MNLEGIELSQEDVDALVELDNLDHQLIVGWAYLRSHLRRAVGAGDASRLRPLVLAPVLERVCNVAKQEIPSESPRLQLLDVDWLDAENVLYKVREVEPSALSRALVGDGLLLEATVSCARGAEWCLRELAPRSAPDPDHPIRDGLYGQAPRRQTPYRRRGRR